MTIHFMGKLCVWCSFAPVIMILWQRLSIENNKTKPKITDKQFSRLEMAARTHWSKSVLSSRALCVNDNDGDDNDIEQHIIFEHFGILFIKLACYVDKMTQFSFNAWITTQSHIMTKKASVRFFFLFFLLLEEHFLSMFTLTECVNNSKCSTIHHIM